MEFEALLASVESLSKNLPQQTTRVAVSRRSSTVTINSIAETLQAMKRKPSDEHSVEKRLKISNSLAKRLKSVALDTSLDRYMDALESPLPQAPANSINPSIKPLYATPDSHALARIYHIAAANSCSIEQAHNKWIEHLQATESNFAQLTTRLALDSYQDLKLIMTQINESCIWICGGEENIANVALYVPTWKLLERAVIDGMKFIHIVEDMNESVLQKTPIILGNLSTDQNCLNEYINSKKLIHGDIMTGINRLKLDKETRNLPFEDVKHIIARFNLFIANLIKSHLSHLQHAMNTLDIRACWDHPLNMLLASIQLTENSAELMDRSSKEFADIKDQVFCIVVLLVEASIPLINRTIKKSRIADTKISHYYQRIISALETFANLISSSNESVPTSMTTCSSEVSLFSVENVSARPEFGPLLHAIIEAGLILCEYSMENRQQYKQGMRLYLIKCAMRLCIVSAHVLDSILEYSIKNRIRSLEFMYDGE